MRILFDSKSEIHKKPFGCLNTDEICTLNVHIPEHCRTERVFLKLEGEDGFALTVPFWAREKQCGYEIFTTEFSLFREGLYFYYFVIETKDSTFSLFREGYSDTNIEIGDKWQVTCVGKDTKGAEDFYGRVFYQIFPDRFSVGGKILTEGKLEPYFLHKYPDETPNYLPDENGKIVNNDFFGGNLRGICEKLDYIKSLGVGAIYLNPIFFAFSNHRYDTADYKIIDPMLGTEKDFYNLCQEAHKRDIKVVLDGVFSHTGSDSIYFDRNGRFGTGILSDENSPYKNWFQKKDENGDFVYWWGIETLPCTNELNPDYMNYIIFDDDSVIAHWMKLGADGFRLDVADELPDEFIYALHKRVKEINPSAIVIGEVWEDASNKISYGKRRRYFTDSELDSVMNYPFRNGIISYINGADGVKLAEEIMNICENYPSYVQKCLLNSLSTHDTPRILTVLADNKNLYSKGEKANITLSEEELENAIRKEKAAVFLQYILPGCPCIYYGDEVGMEGYEDPFNRKFFPWNKINNDLLSFYKEMGKIRNHFKSLSSANTHACGSGEKLQITRGSLKALVNAGEEYLKVEFNGKVIISQECKEENGEFFLGRYGFLLIE